MTLLGLRAEHFDEVLASDPMIARRVLSVVMRRLGKTDRRLAELEDSPPCDVPRTPVGRSDQIPKALRSGTTVTR